MADDRMRNNDDLDRNMSHKDQNKYGQKSPARNQQDDDFKTGKRAGQRGDEGHIKNDYGTSEKSGSGQGGQNRPNR